jgi:hypothetical protein
MREDGDTLERFGRRVRMNETAARRVHDLTNRTRTRERLAVGRYFHDSSTKKGKARDFDRYWGSNALAKQGSV